MVDSSQFRRLPDRTALRLRIRGTKPRDHTPETGCGGDAGSEHVYVKPVRSIVGRADEPDMGGRETQPTLPVHDQCKGDVRLDEHALAQLRRMTKPGSGLIVSRL